MYILNTPFVDFRHTRELTSQQAGVR